MAIRTFPISTGKTSWSDFVGVKWDVQLQESSSGLYRSIVEQDLPKYEYSLVFSALTTEEKDILIGFFNECRGQLLPFYIKLFGAYVENQPLAKLSDGKFQLVKPIGNTVEAVNMVDNLVVFKNGVQTNSFTQENGKISISANQGEITASYDYFERVRFSGGLSVTQKFNNIWTCTLKVVTAR